MTNTDINNNARAFCFSGGKKIMPLSSFSMVPFLVWCLAKLLLLRACLISSAGVWGLLSPPKNAAPFWAVHFLIEDWRIRTGALDELLEITPYASSAGRSESHSLRH